jgi:RND family efflux transporter MFP subunit
VLLLLLGAATGCNRVDGKANATPPPAEVQVAYPVKRTVRDYEDFPGKTMGNQEIEIRARVTGHLLSTPFKEGADVKKGDLLFEIDPRQYKAELTRAEATLLQAQARSARLTSDLERAKELLAKRAIGREEFDKIAGDRSEAVEAVGVAQANRELAKLNVTYCTIHAEVDGRISRRYIDPQNLVKANDTVLTSLVSLDPMYAYFDVDERAERRLKELIKQGKLDFSSEAKQPVWMGLANEGDRYPRHGTIDFTDNRIDSDTGTWRLRGVFKNTDHSLTSGLFARIRLPIGEPYEALLVAEEALGTDQGKRFVYVVDEKNIAKYQSVTVGRLHNGLRVITDGLKPEQRIVVKGLQRVRPNAPVSPKEVKMPEPTKTDDKVASK